MGTNKSKINNLIAKKVKGRPVDEVKEKLPEITKMIRGNYIRDEISEQGFQSIVGVVGGKLKNLYINEDEVEGIQVDEVKREEWIEEILELIENNLDDVSIVLEKALHLALAKTVREKEDAENFVYNLLYYMVFLGLENTMQGALGTVDKGMTIPQIREIFITPIADKIFEEDIKIQIPSLLRKELSLDEVNKIIMRKLKKFGGF